MKSYKVGVLGATGAVGQKFLRLLENHPWFRLTEVYASERSGGKRYAEATNWLEETPLPKHARGMQIKYDSYDLDADILFSAIPGGKAGPVEREFAKRGYAVFSNARDLRMEPDVPLVIAEVNADHLKLIDVQKKKRKSEGFVVTNGNCTTIVLALSLKPLQDQFGLKEVQMVSMQALSGAGYPGVASLDIMENVVPFIGGEEEKVAAETPKFLGSLNGAKVNPAKLTLSATCTRVPVIEGHTEAISVKLNKQANAKDVLAAFRDFRGDAVVRKLPSAPKRPIVVRSEENRPQPRKDRAEGNYMSVVVGRLRPDPVLDWKYVAMGSNTVRGASGASILNAELAAAMGYL